MDGLAIRRLRRAPIILNENYAVPFSQLEVLLESGLGLQGAGLGSDPKVMMRYSSDGGHTWSNERLASAGKTGNYRQRVRWKRLGVGRERVFEISVSDPIVNWRVIDAFVNNTEDRKNAA